MSAAAGIPADHFRRILADHFRRASNPTTIALGI